MFSDVLLYLIIIPLFPQWSIGLQLHHTKVLGRVVNTVVARERTGLQMSKAGHPVQDLLTIAQNREAWGVLLPAAAIHMLPPTTGASQGTTDQTSIQATQSGFLSLQTVSTLCLGNTFQCRLLYSVHFSVLHPSTLFMFAIVSSVWYCLFLICILLFIVFHVLEILYNY